MSLVNRTNDQFIQPKINNRTGVVCSGQTGGGYGATNESLASSANFGIGKSIPFTNKHYYNCDTQKGGGAHNYDGDFGNPISYGYNSEVASYAGEVRGSYAPIGVNKPQTQCGAGKKRKAPCCKHKKCPCRKKGLKKCKCKCDKKRKTKQNTKRRKGGRKSRKGGRKKGGRRRTKRRKSGRRKTKRRKGGRRRTKRRRSSRKLRGGGYSQFGSNVAATPSYSTPNVSNLPWATGPVSHKRQFNCQDNYNHFKK
jgi:hypothetical protein